MTMTQTEMIGFGKNFIELVDRAAPIMDRAGFDSAKIKAVVTEKVEKAAAANARQEEMKRELKEQTELTTTLMDDLYRTTSGYLDAAIAAAGKGTEEARNFQRLRSRVRRPDEGADVEPATPGTPTPGAQP